MTEKICTVIVGTGCYVPEEIVTNSDFLSRQFLDTDGSSFDKTSQEIVDKLETITGIKERRHIASEQVTSEIATYAAEDALQSSGFDRETLDYIIVAHNFGDVKDDTRRSDMVPSLATRVKHRLEIKNPQTVAYDVIFGCPGWLQGMIQADFFLKAGEAKHALVIGAESLSRVSDPHDRDSMLYSDGAGATILSAYASDKPVGVLSHAARTDTLNHAYMLWMDKSYDARGGDENLYLKMLGRKLYQYAVTTVPQTVKQALDKAGLGLCDVHKVLIHQANERMDDAILKRIFKLYGVDAIPEHIMPMTIEKLGNSSVATLPTMLDLITKGKLEGHVIKPGENLVFASVGAGMNINAMVYRVP
jgi:3-oxoacyl-[acyl-carrier-protein] synthase-3